MNGTLIVNDVLCAFVRGEGVGIDYGGKTSDIRFICGLCEGREIFQIEACVDIGNEMNIN